MEHQDVAAHEKRAIEEVRKRLADRFPALERAVVDEAVDTALTHLDGPVRDFIPILVERAAAEELKGLSGSEHTPTLTSQRDRAVGWLTSPACCGPLSSGTVSAARSFSQPVLRGASIRSERGACAACVPSIRLRGAGSSAEARGGWASPPVLRPEIGGRCRRRGAPR